MARKAKDKDNENDDDGETRTVRGAGDNAPEVEVSGKKLMGFVNELEKLNNKKGQVLQEIREVYADAKGVGLDGKVIRTILRERAMEPEKRKEQAQLLHLYKAAIGMLDDENE